MSTTYDASLYTNSYLNASGADSGPLYIRTTTNVLNATTDTATQLGTLTQNKTQLDASSTLSRANATNFYKFTLDGNSLKLHLGNTTSIGEVNLRVQVLNSSGKVVADSSTYGTEANQTAYESLSSSDGLDLKAGDYYVKVTYDSNATRSVDQSYSLALYSGTTFYTSYKTTAKSQTSATQVVTNDNTMTYSLVTAKAYSANKTHLANETATDGINLGWFSENKSALSVTSMISSVCDEEYYSMTLQQGDNIKLAFTNHTDTAALRVQLYDSTGTYLYADSEGTEEQKAAYAELNSSTGLSAKAGNYVVKVSYKQGETKLDQTYDMKIYSGEYYDNLYETTAATETAGTAILSGHLDTYNQGAALATYMATQMSENLDAVFYYLYQKTV